MGTPSLKVAFTTLVSSPMLPRLGLLTWELFLCPIKYLLSSPTSTMERERPRLTPTPWPRSLLVRLLEESSPMLEGCPSFLILLLLPTIPTAPIIPTLPTMERERPRPSLSPTPRLRSLLVKLLEESSPMLEGCPLFLILILLSTFTLPTIPTAFPLSTTARQTDCYLTQDGKC